MMRLNQSSLGISRYRTRICSSQSSSNAIFGPLLFLTSHAFSSAPSPSSPSCSSSCSCSSSLSFHPLLRTTTTTNRDEKKFLIASSQRRSLSTVAPPIGGVSRTGAGGEEGGIIPPLENNDFNSTVSRVWVKVKEELTHMKKGSIALGRNIAAVVRIGLAKIRDGTPVTRRERQLLVQTFADVLRLIPFAVIVIVPFMEFSLPFLLKFFPGLLPSTFTSQASKSEAQQRALQAKIEVVKFLIEASDELETRAKFDTIEDKNAFRSFIEKLRKGEHIERENLLRFGEILKTEFSLQRLDLIQLKALCKFFGLPTAIGSSFLLREALIMKIDQIYEDDRSIRREGVENLTLDELYEAGVTRGIVRRYGTIDGLAPEERRQRLHELLQDWVELTAVPIPIYLHLLARVNTLEKAAPLSSALVVPTIEPVTPETLPLEPSTAETVTVPTPSVPVVPEPTPTMLVPPKGEKVGKEGEPTPFVLQGYADIKKMFLPQLIEVKAARALQAETTKQTEGKLQQKINSKIESMVTEIEDELKKIDPKTPVVETPVIPSKELSPTAVSFIKATFAIFDINGDGVVNLEELSKGIQGLGITASEEEVKAIFDEVDVDKSGGIDSEEFVKCVIILYDRLEALEAEKHLQTL